jgi:hypothetical protein
MDVGMDGPESRRLQPPNPNPHGYWMPLLPVKRRTNSVLAAAAEDSALGIATSSTYSKVPQWVPKSGLAGSLLLNLIFSPHGGFYLSL